jgi:hypothetical protein
MAFGSVYRYFGFGGAIGFACGFGRFRFRSVSESFPWLSWELPRLLLPALGFRRVVHLLRRVSLFRSACCLCPACWLSISLHFVERSHGLKKLILLVFIFNYYVKFFRIV